MGKMENKVALIIAASRGIGKACAEEFALQGAKKIYIADWLLDEAVELADILSKKYKTIVKALYFNAFKPETYAPMIKEVLTDSEGTLHVLVNNFGITDQEHDKDLLNTDYEAWHKVLLSNLDSVFLPSQLCLPAMIQSGGGSIINISSMASRMPNITRITYNTLKGAINVMTQNIATQYARQNIRCNAVLPGMIMTNATKDTDKDYLKLYTSHVPLNRLGRPEEVAKVVSFFASEESSYVTGQCLEVSGGISMPTPLFADTIGTIK